MDYLQYNNDARAIAREVAFMKDDNFSNDVLTAEKTKELEDRYFKNRTDMYTAKLAQPTKNTSEVEVQITFELNGKWGLADFINFPPDTLKTIVYIMPIEKAALVDNTNEE